MIYKLAENYYLRMLSMADVNGAYPTWFEDQEVCKHTSHGKVFKTRADFEDYVNQLSMGDRIVLAICHSSDGHIGNVSLQNISFVDRTAEFAIVLGDRRHWGKGVGLLAARAIVEHGFRKVNLERIHCGTAVTNIGMQKLAVALGMIEEGRRREHIYLDGERVDVIEYGLMRKEFGRAGN